MYDSQYHYINFSSVFICYYYTDIDQSILLSIFNPLMKVMFLHVLENYSNAASHQSKLNQL